MSNTGETITIRPRHLCKHTGKHIHARCINRAPAPVRGLLDRCRSCDRAIISILDKITIITYVSGPRLTPILSTSREQGGYLAGRIQSLIVISQYHVECGMASELADVANIAPGIQRGGAAACPAMRPDGSAYPRCNAQPADKLGIDSPDSRTSATTWCPSHRWKSGPGSVPRAWIHSATLAPLLRARSSAVSPGGPCR